MTAMKPAWLLLCPECYLPDGHHDWCISRPPDHAEPRRQRKRLKDHP